MPNKIHAIWIGGNPNPLALACMDDWQKQGYNFKLWSEKDNQIMHWINNCEFAKKCYQKKLYAFVTDYLRLKILQLEGGLYLDTDVTIRKSPFHLFNNIDFCVGYESPSFLGTAIIYSNKNSELLNILVNFYEAKIMQSHLYIGPGILTEIVNNYSGKDKILLTDEVFFYSYKGNGSLPHNSENSYLIHWFQHSWKNPRAMYFLKSKHLNFINKFYEWQKYFLRRLLKR